ncbi:LLM class flavin-dependent oxidoreductase [Actinomadura mexicana]|uniref:Luciferase-like monooxygenase n=1 Tax=Actinomadura mexicana TaxID=134959 RepID=A0A238UPA9_9ACTN|nr:LLM class flavin-dependent oxidoreductase [Actinomadura mexicana]SNR23935.1 Luciferase-like monooxygenase [Actinomadura mexicana]
MTAALFEIGYYGLAGRIASPLDVVAEAQQAERLGIGAMFLSERINVKDAGVVAGAVAAATGKIGIGTAATNHNTWSGRTEPLRAPTCRTLSGVRRSVRGPGRP